MVAPIRAGSKLLVIFGALLLSFGSPVQAQGQARVVPQGFNPISQFCHRFLHQTAIVDDRLYIDGGYLQISTTNPGDSPLTNYSNPSILYHDLTTIYRDGTYVGQPPLVTTLRQKPADVPSLAGGVLWADTVNKKLFLYGGQFTNEQPVPFDLWMYDTLYDTWQVMNQSSTGDVGQISRAFNGAGTAVDRLGLGYYLGGWVGSVSEYGYEGNDVAISGLLIYDMVGNTWTNQTVPDSQRRVEGVMLYVPLSDDGLLVVFGGMRVVDGDPNNATTIPMSEISVYNIASNTWYTQTATGEIPPDRRLFCAGVASGEAPWYNGTELLVHNIYLYGGASAGEGSGYDDVYILSLPTFVWTKYWPAAGDNTNSHPHHSLSCNVVLNSQMLIIGGVFPNNDGCDAVKVSGAHGLNLSGSLSDSTVWPSEFEPNLDDYHVPTTVLSNFNIETGNPVISWGDRDLSILITRTPPTATRTPTRAVTTPKPAISTKERNIIIGVVVPVVFLALLGIGICIFFRRKKNRRQRPVEPTNSNVTYIQDHPIHIPEQTQLIKDHFGSPIQDAPQYIESQHLPEVPQPPEPFPSPPLRHVQPVSRREPVPVVPPEPVAYIRNPVTGAITPVYDQVDAIGRDTSPRPESGRTASFAGSLSTTVVSHGDSYELENNGRRPSGRGRYARGPEFGPHELSGV
ncbi:hypothetical protein H072_6347 [Dactylellina haptotyla CBS 200.50]|uniref:Uncharacterized protein n=1 Tax=Dactylellina haptotyla (strain CBS 200.50) TaxID=1284197 RepID=S8BX57_DACHA|nr:hypothetical protein H072_6347 [Dactylellina haptotyla CBS 200.50]